MAPESRPPAAGRPAEEAFSYQLAGENTPTLEAESWPGQVQDVSRSSRPTIRRVIVLGTLIGIAILGAATILLVMKNGHAHSAVNGANASTEEDERNKSVVIPVNTIRPRRKTLERTLEQPGTIRPWAQAELYAKASGYLKTIQRTPTPSFVAELVAQGASGLEPGTTGAARWTTMAQLAWGRAPQKDIGSPVAKGELLLEIATPERTQEIMERVTKVSQREAELEAARKALATYQAAIAVAKAQEVQAKADIRKFESEYAFRHREWQRLKSLVETKTVPLEIAEEKENQVNAAFAAWDSSKAKVQTAQAELAVVSSKFAAAQADITVKESLVQVAKDELRLAYVIEDYSRIYAPFDGFITSRDVDEGDFVQNSTTGQTRRLMTVTALDKVKVVLHVPDMYAPWVQVGTEATLAVQARTVNQVRGVVSRIANALDPQIRTMQVEIDLDNREHQLLPGMYGKVTMTLQKILNAQAIPATAVYSRKGENFILEVQKGVARRQPVRIRFDDGKQMEVVKLIGSQEIPLNGSEELIISNKGEIRNGQRVKTSLLTSHLIKAAPGRPIEVTIHVGTQRAPVDRSSRAIAPDLLGAGRLLSLFAA